MKTENFREEGGPMTDKSLEEFFDERLQGAHPPEPLEMGVSAVKNTRLPIETIGDLKRAQSRRLRRIKEKMRKYFLY